MTERLSGLPGWIWDGAGDNPLFGFLHFADHILVTEDSANMAAEAASTGKPVHILPMVPLKSAGKFARLHDDLRSRGAARPFDGALIPWTYEPLAETDRAQAQQFLGTGAEFLLLFSGIRIRTHSLQWHSSGFHDQGTTPASLLCYPMAKPYYSIHSSSLLLLLMGLRLVILKIVFCPS